MCFTPNRMSLILNQNTTQIRKYVEKSEPLCIVNVQWSWHYGKHYGNSSIVVWYRTSSSEYILKKIESRNFNRDFLYPYDYGHVVPSQALDGLLSLPPTLDGCVTPMRQRNRIYLHDKHYGGKTYGQVKNWKQEPNDHTEIVIYIFTFILWKHLYIFT